MGLIARARGGSAKEAEITVQSAEAAKGSISATVAGTGTLAGGASTDVVVPAGIKVKGGAGGKRRHGRGRADSCHAG